MKPLELKARLLCEGANPEDEKSVEALQSQNPQKVLRGGLSSGLKARLTQSGSSGPKLPKEIKVNFPLYERIPVDLKVRADKDGQLVFTKNGEEIGRGEVIKPPEWYGKEIDGYPITSIVTQHGDQLAASVWEWCSLFNNGQQCKFCVMDRSQINPALRSPAEKTRLILEALRVIPRDVYKGLSLNSGMNVSAARGLDDITMAIEKIRAEIPDIPIAAEITPPQDAYIDFLKRFADAGGESLMMNIETWDPERRRQLIPGKDRYCPRDSYLVAFREAVQLLGKGKVSTCFIVGTEPKESLKEGIKTVVGYDVIPSPIAGRYFEGIADYKFDPRADWREFLEIFRFAREQMAAKGLIPNDTAGCVACGMCDIIGDANI